MANAFKRKHQWSVPTPGAPAVVPDRRAAAGVVVIALAGLGTLALALPRPFASIGSDAAGAGAVTERALLSAAGLTVWGLLGWHLLVVAAAILGRLPGRTGQSGRALLCGLAPWTATRVAAAAVGLTLLSGTSACSAGAPHGGATGAAASTGSASTSIADTGPADNPTGESAGHSAGAAGSGQVIASISIDWPDSSAAGVAPSATQPANGSSTRTSATASPAATAAPSPSTPTPTAGASTAPAPAPARSAGPVITSSDTRVAVRAGDSLWSIAHRYLPADATDLETDIAWRAWYDTNSNTIGDDPDLIQPGQLLLPPTARTG